MSRESIPVCSVHNKFQNENGRWLNKSEDFMLHILYTRSQEAELIETVCPECDDPDQTSLFED